MVRRSTTHFLLVHWMALVLIGAFAAAPAREVVESGQPTCLIDAESPGPGPSLHKPAEGNFACAAEFFRQDQALANVCKVAPDSHQEHPSRSTTLQAAGVRLQV
jgi:hypothetical protein